MKVTHMYRTEIREPLVGSPPHRITTNAKGFTLIELMIVIAIIAIILTLALPVYTNYSIRAKLGEALSVAAAAKTAVAATCNEHVTLPALDNDLAGYGYSPSTWVQSIEISGPCTEPVITVLTQDTGAQPDPQIVLTGAFATSTSAINWVCTSDAEDFQLPPTCRGS